MRLWSVIGFFLMLVACSSPYGGSITVRGRSIMSSNRTIAELNALANEKKASRADRARAVFSLFANYIRPGDSAVEIRRVLVDTRWLQESTVEGVYDIAGWVPADFTADDTVFSIHLLHVGTDKERSPWFIYFRLSGRHSYERERDGLRFFQSDTTLPGNPKIIEFALCFPEGGRVERFTMKGVHVYMPGEY